MSIAVVAIVTLVYLSLPESADRVARKHIASLQSHDWRALYRITPHRERSDVGWTEDQFVQFCSILIGEDRLALDWSSRMKIEDSTIDGTRGRVKFEIALEEASWNESHQRDLGRYVFHARREPSGEWRIAAAPAIIFLARRASPRIADFHAKLAAAMRDSNQFVLPSFEYGEAYTYERLQSALAGMISHDDVKVTVEQLRSEH
jgi:hypothetical protein